MRKSVWDSSWSEFVSKNAKALKYQSAVPGWNIDNKNVDKKAETKLSECLSESPEEEITVAPLDIKLIPVTSIKSPKIKLIIALKELKKSTK